MWPVQVAPFPGPVDLLQAEANMPFASSVLLPFSPTGTTRTVLQAIGQGLGGPVRLADMTMTADRKPLGLAPGELLVIGFPVYVGRLPELCNDIFALLPVGVHPVLPVVVYGNRAYDDALLELADLCCAKGYHLVGAAAFIGQHSFDAQLAAGRPNAEDTTLARHFGATVAAALRAGKRFDPASLPGNRPYRTVPEALRRIPPPDGDMELCTDCQACVEQCPMNAIEAATPCVTNVSRCIMCAACIHICPFRARAIRVPQFTAHMAEIARNNAAPKTPDLFAPV